MLMTLRQISHLLPFHHAIYVLGLTLVGRNRCGLTRALRENSAYRRKHSQAMASISARSRVVKRDPTDFVLIDTPHGPYWTPAGMDLFSVLAECAVGLYSSGHGLREGDIVLDCGANVGVFVREALVAGAATVVALEPSPLNVECLRRNFASEIAAGRVVVVDRGVWHHEETLRFSVSKNSLRDSFVLGDAGRHGGKTLELRVTTIDDVRRTLGLARVDFIKMDIEGAEQEALAGAQQTLARDHPRMSIAAYHKADDVTAIPAVVRRAWPDCQIACGPCKSTFGRVQPETLYFSG